MVRQNAQELVTSDPRRVGLTVPAPLRATEGPTVAARSAVEVAAGSGGVAGLVRLQRTAGNRAVVAMLQHDREQSRAPAPAPGASGGEPGRDEQPLHGAGHEEQPVGGEPDRDEQPVGGEPGREQPPRGGSAPQPPTGVSLTVPPRSAPPAWFTVARKRGGRSRPRLGYTTVTPRQDSGGCGGYVWAVRWTLDGADATTNGFIVQRLTFRIRQRDCNGARQNWDKEYWEAWEVRGGQIFVGTSSSPHQADTFRYPSRPGRRGRNVEIGRAKFIPGYTAPHSWGNVPEAGSLPATTSRPAGWSNSGALTRSIRSRFDCCDGRTRTRVTGSG